VLVGLAAMTMAGPAHFLIETKEAGGSPHPLAAPPPSSLGLDYSLDGGKGMTSSGHVAVKYEVCMYV
jgi:hypothetical protein